MRKLTDEAAKSEKKIRRKGTVCAVSFDIKKAFDYVPFSKLIDCLRTEFGVPDCLLVGFPLTLKTEPSLLKCITLCHLGARLKQVLSKVP